MWRWKNIWTGWLSLSQVSVFILLGNFYTKQNKINVSVELDPFICQHMMYFQQYYWWVNSLITFEWTYEVTSRLCDQFWNIILHIFPNMFLILLLYWVECLQVFRDETPWGSLGFVNINHAGRIKSVECEKTLCLLLANCWISESSLGRHVMMQNSLFQPEIRSLWCIAELWERMLVWFGGKSSKIDNYINTN